MNSELSTGPGSEGGPILAILSGPCHNFQSANDLNERFKLVDGENAFAMLSQPLP